MNADRTVLTDAMWARACSMLTGEETDLGVTATDNRQLLEAVLWRIRTGSPWRDLSGIFERVFNELSDEFDLEYVFVDGTIV